MKLRRLLGGVVVMATAALTHGALAQGGPPSEQAPAAESVAAPVPRQVRVALVNLQDAAAVGAIPSSEPARTGFRHTFGAERKTEIRAQRLDPSAWAADVVLIQGFTSLRETRKLFPARGWKLVLSRQLVEAQTTVAQAQRPPATAIALRHRLGLRIAGQELRLDVATGTAARVLVAGVPMWFLSAAPPTAEGASAIEAWLDAKRALGEQTVIGGRLPASIPRDRGPSVPFAPRPDVARPPAMPVLLSTGERRLVDGGNRGFARFPASAQPTPCGGSAAGADVIVVDQLVGDRLKPDTGGWLVTLTKPPPLAPEPASGPLTAAQIKAAPQAGARSAAAPVTPPAPQPAVCILMLDLAT